MGGKGVDFGQHRQIDRGVTQRNVQRARARGDVAGLAIVGPAFEGDLIEARGEVVDRYRLYHQIEERDARDQANPHGGFYQAPDAHLLDTTLLDIEAALRAAVAIVDAAVAGKAGQTP